MMFRTNSENLSNSSRKRVIVKSILVTNLFPRYSKTIRVRNLTFLPNVKQYSFLNLTNIKKKIGYFYAKFRSLKIFYLYIFYTHNKL